VWGANREMASLFTKDAVLETVTVSDGLKKEVIKRGAEGGARPKQGQMTRAHYTGKLLNGTVFDSSRSRGKPFEFPIGVGAVISGWDLGIASMLPCVFAPFAPPAPAPFNPQPRRPHPAAASARCLRAAPPTRMARRARRRTSHRTPRLRLTWS